MSDQPNRLVDVATANLHITDHLDAIDWHLESAANNMQAICALFLKEGAIDSGDQCQIFRNIRHILSAILLYEVADYDQDGDKRMSSWGMARRAKEIKDFYDSPRKRDTMNKISQQYSTMIEHYDGALVKDNAWGRKSKFERASDLIEQSSLEPDQKVSAQSNLNEFRDHCREIALIAQNFLENNEQISR